ncbi:MAG TPA: DUF2252 domain-containing protein [Streptosporangiaceae bacterium]
MNPADRAARGRAARKTAPRSSHAVFEPAPDRPDPVALLEQQGAGRIASLLPIRYGRMLASPFAFLRGGALIMATDLAPALTTGITVQACGDAHLSNFGIYASPERRLVFDVNDFDETLPAPWEWDVKRLATSIEVAGRDNGASPAQRRRAVVASMARYRATMRGLARRPELSVWYAEAELDELGRQFRQILGQRERKLGHADLARLRDRDAQQPVSKLVHTVRGEPRIVARPPLVVPVSDLPGVQAGDGSRPGIEQVLAVYRRTLPLDRQHLLSRFRVADAALKVVGVGSVGTGCWIIALTGRDPSDLLVLQVKQATASVLSRFAGPSSYASMGQRVVAGQQLMQATSDIFLGWHPAAGGSDAEVGDCYVRQLRDWKYSLPVEVMRPGVMRRYGELCGQTLARAHARSGDRIAIAAYLGSGDVFDQAVADFAATYADQNERDHAALAAAVSAGRLPARTGI